MRTFAPKNTFAYCSDLRRVYMGTAPTLKTLGAAYGDALPDVWVSTQIHALSEDCGCKDKMTPQQVRSTARTIVAVFGYLNVVELMHFFLLFRAGEYGRFYGSVDGLVITEALQAFVRQRRDRISGFEAEAEAEKRKAQWERQRKYAISYEEWKRRQGEKRAMLHSGPSEQVERQAYTSPLTTE